MRNKYFCLLLFFAFAINAQESKEAHSKKVTLPINLSADKGVYQPSSNIAVYEGNVKISQGEMRIFADKITLYLKKGGVKRIEAIGNPVKFRYVIRKKRIYGESKKIVYQVAEKIARLTGSAFVKQGEDTVRGDLLTYDLKKETIQGARVKMTLSPQ